MASTRARTVRDETFDLLRRLDLTTLFSNPGSTEVPLLAGLPDDLRFVLALHEGSVVGGPRATRSAGAPGDRPVARRRRARERRRGAGHGPREPGAAGGGRRPADRRHLAQEPFLAGQLAEIAGAYPVNVEVPVRAQDVPGAIGRAYHEAVAGRGRPW